MDWEARVRRAGGSLAALSLLGLLVGGALYAFTALVGGGGLTARASQLIIGSFIAGLVGAMLLLLAPDTVPPEERP